jgi:REP element-mobilizing transposase RayT
MPVLQGTLSTSWKASSWCLWCSGVIDEEVWCQAYFRDVVRKVSKMHVRKEFQYCKGANAVFSAFA